MISEFYIENQRTQKRIYFGLDGEVDYIFTHIDWGNITAVHSTYNYPKQIGSSISSTRMYERDVMIEGYVSFVLTRDKINELGRNDAIMEGYASMLRKKNVLSEMMNPNDAIRIVIGDYFIEGKPSATVIFGDTEEENNEYFCKFLISLYCSNPMFRKISQVKTNLSKSTPAFHFPLILPPYGEIMSSRENYLVLAVTNEGNNEVGGIITFEAKGEVENPALENLSTGEKIVVNKTLQKGEKIVIDTSNGEKSIVGIINGIETNYFKYWDFDNEWMKFEPGTVLVGYSTKNGSESMLDVIVEINPEKFALEEM